MKHKTNQILFAYWNDVRGTRMAPRRFEIEPARIAAILPETFILEKQDSDTYSYRLAGTKLCEQFGLEFRGTNFLDGWSEADRATLSHALAKNVSTGAVLVLDVEAGPLDASLGRVKFEMALMPLVHSSSAVSRLLGAASLYETANWIGSERLFSKRPINHSVVWPDGRPYTAADGFRQPPALASLAGARLVKFDRRSFRVLDGGRANAVGDDA